MSDEIESGREGMIMLDCLFCGVKPPIPRVDEVVGTCCEFECDCGRTGVSVQICDLMTVEERVNAQFINHMYPKEYRQRALDHCIKLWNDQCKRESPKGMSINPKPELRQELKAWLSSLYEEDGIRFTKMTEAKQKEIIEDFLYSAHRAVEGGIFSIRLRDGYKAVGVDYKDFKLERRHFIIEVSDPFTGEITLIGK